MGALVLSLFLMLTGLADHTYAQCQLVRLTPNSASLSVTETVDKPLSIIRCSTTVNTVTSDVAAESISCRILQIVDSISSTSGINANIFTVLRDSNSLLINTVGEWRIIFNSAASANLQRIVGTQYRILIGCSDAQGSLTVDNNMRAFLLVSITPNLSPTIFNAPGAIVTRNAKTTGKGFLLFTMTVNDHENDFITYSLSTQPIVDYFLLDTSNGEIRTAVDLKTAIVDNIFIRVNVSDGYNTVGPFTITVRLFNLNTRPDITNLPTSIEIREDAIGGFLVNAMTVVDPDIFTDLSSLTPDCSVTPSSGSSKFVQKGNIFRLSNFNPEQSIFDYETTRAFTIFCSVTDGFLTSLNEKILVNISNVNEPPVFNEKIYFCSLLESNAGGSSCDLGLSIFDPESNPYSILLLPGNNSQRFALRRSLEGFGSVNVDNQRLTFNINYDLDEAQLPSNVFVTIAAVDSIGATGTAKVSISILDDNDNSPIFTEVLSAITVDYSTKLGIVGAITATDKDRGSNGQIDFKLIDVNPVNYITYVSALGNGEIHYSRQYPERIAGSSALLTIRATDRGSPPRSSTGTVAVSFLATTTSSSTTTPAPTTTTKTTTTTTATITTTEYNFLAHPENVVMLVALLIAVFIAIAILLFLCARYSTQGYFCPPTSGADPSDDYAYNSRQGSPSYDDYRGKPDYFETQKYRGGGNGNGVPRREMGPGGRALPAVKY